MILIVPVYKPRQIRYWRIIWEIILPGKETVYLCRKAEKTEKKTIQKKAARSGKTICGVREKIRKYEQENNLRRVLIKGLHKTKIKVKKITIKRQISKRRKSEHSSSFDFEIEKYFRLIVRKIASAPPRLKKAKSKLAAALILEIRGDEFLKKYFPGLPAKNILKLLNREVKAETAMRIFAGRMKRKTKVFSRKSKKSFLESEKKVAAFSQSAFEASKKIFKIFIIGARIGWRQSARAAKKTGEVFFETAENIMLLWRQFETKLQNFSFQEAGVRYAAEEEYEKEILFAQYQEEPHEEDLVPLSDIAGESKYKKGYLVFEARMGKLKARKIEGVWKTTAAWLAEFAAMAERRKEEYRNDLSQKMGGAFQYQFEAAPVRNFNFRIAASFAILIFFVGAANANFETLEIWKGTASAKTAAAYNGYIGKVSADVERISGGLASVVSGFTISSQKISKISRDTAALRRVRQFKKDAGLNLAGDEEKQKQIAESQNGIVAGEETSGYISQSLNSQFVQAGQNLNESYWNSWKARHAVKMWNLATNSVKSKKIKDYSVEARDLSDNAVKSRTIENGSIHSEDLAKNIAITGSFNTLGPLTIGRNTTTHDLGTEGDLLVSNRLEVDGPAYLDSTLYVKGSSSLSSLSSTTLATQTANISNLLSNSNLTIRGRLPDEDTFSIYEFTEATINPSGLTMIGEPVPVALDTAAKKEHSLVVKNNLEVQGIIYGTVFGAAAGPASTTDLPEGTNLYYLDSRARNALSSTATGLTYASGTGIFSLTAGYVIPTTAQETNWGAAYTNRVVTWNAPLSFAGNIASLNYNATNLQLTLNALNTIQDIAASSSPTFAGLTLSGDLALGASTVTTTDATVISNLNADLLDGQHGAYYAAALSILGTENYLAKFGAGGTSVGNSVVYDNGTNVGIGTTAPGAKLEVSGLSVLRSTGAHSLDLYTSGGFLRTYVDLNGDINATTFFSGNIYIGGANNSIVSSASVGYRVGIGLAAPGEKLSVAGDVMIGDSTWSAGTTTGSLAVQGNVGIGTTAPATALHVAGAGYFTTGAYIGAYNTDNLIDDASNGAGSTTLYIGNKAIATVGSGGSISGTQNLLAKFTSTTAVGDSRFFDNGTNIGIGNTNPLTYLNIGNAIYMTALGGNVGIGTTAPGNKLTVSGGVGIGTTAPGSLFLSTAAPSGGLIVEGNVGIGTNSPQGKFEVVSGGSGPSLADVVPDMTSNNTPLGVASASTEFAGNYGAWAAFNDNTGDYWETSAGNTTGWLAYEFSAAKVIVRYTLQVSTTDRAPKTWTFEGWDGAQYVVLDTQTDITSWVNGVVKTFNIGNSTSYIKYRINVTANNGNGTYLTVNEMEMMDNSGPGTAFLVDATTGNAAFGYSSSGSAKLAINGNVGIGTTSPTAQLHLVKADSSALTDILVNPTVKTSGNLIDLRVGGSSKFRVDNFGSVTMTMGGVSIGSILNYTSGLVFRNNNPLTGNGLTFNDLIAYSNLSGASAAISIAPSYNQASGTASNTDLLIDRVETAVGSGAQYLIDAGVNTGSHVSKFSITNTGQGYFAGNVGIGTTAPGAALQIAGTSGIMMGYNSAQLQPVRIYADSGDSMYLSVNGGSGKSMNLVTGYSGISLNSTFLTLTGGMTGITMNGNVGIGYTNPGTAKLAVNGNVGIGTTAPGYKLAIDGGAGSTSGLQITNLGTANYGINMDNSQLSTSADYWFYLDSTHYWRADGYLKNGSNYLDATTNTLYTGTINSGSVNSNLFRPYTAAQNFIARLQNSSYNFSFQDASSNPLMTILGTGGFVGIGTTAPGQELEVNGQIRFVDAVGDNLTYVCKNSAGDLANCVSLEKYKNEIANLDAGLDTLNQLRPVQFKWDSTGKMDLGFIAEEVQKVNPLLTIYDEKGNLTGVKYPQLTALLTKAVQEQQTMISQSLTLGEANSRTLGEMDLEITANNSDVAGLQAAVNDKLNIISQSLTLGEANNLALGARIDTYDSEILEIKTKLAAAETKLVAAENNLADFQTSTTDVIASMLETENMLTEKILSHEDRLATLEARMTALSVSGSGGSEALPENILLKDALGNAALAGVFKVKNVEAEGIIAGKIDAKSIELGGDVSGKATLSAGDTNKKIPTAKVSSESKIYVTPLGKLSGRSLYIDMETVEQGESFTVELDGEPLAKDVELNWLIVN